MIKILTSVLAGDEHLVLGHDVLGAALAVVVLPHPTPQVIRVPPESVADVLESVGDPDLGRSLRPVLNQLEVDRYLFGRPFWSCKTEKEEGGTCEKRAFVCLW